MVFLEFLLPCFFSFFGRRPCSSAVGFLEWVVPSSLCFFWWVFGADLGVRWCDPEKKMDGATKVSYQGGVLREFGGICSVLRSRRYYMAVNLRCYRAYDGVPVSEEDESLSLLSCAVDVGCDWFCSIQDSLTAFKIC